MRFKKALLLIQFASLFVIGISAQQISPEGKTNGQVGIKKTSPSTAQSLPATVPVILKSVKQGSFEPTSRTILTVKTGDGQYVVNEVVPDSEGIAQLELPPGRYILSAIGARDSLAFVVEPPRCIFTIQISDSGDPVSLSETTPTSTGERGPIGIDKILGFVFGVSFVIILVIVAKIDRHPSPIGILIYRVVLALAAAGIGAVIPGMINVDINPVIRAGGAIALFVIIYWFKPANLVAGPRNGGAEPGGMSKTTDETRMARLAPLTPSQNAALFESMERFKAQAGECMDKVFEAKEIKRTVTVNPPNAELEVLEDLTNISDRDHSQLTRHVTTDAPTEKKTLGIKAWVTLDGEESEASVDVRPSTDSRFFNIRMSLKGHVVPVRKTLKLRWICKFPGSVALNQDYWVFPVSFYRKRPDRLVMEAVFPNIPADIAFSAVTDAGLIPLNISGPESITNEGKTRFSYSTSIDDPDDFYILQWRIE
ncbi:MAG: hypothetical protein WB780_00430 [Candidatus Acidiferrales bacterium]